MVPLTQSIIQWWDTLPAYVLVLLHSGPAVFSVYHALLYKRDSRSAMGWIMACLFVPFAGPIAYFFFGINRIRNRAGGLRSPFYNIQYESQRLVPMSSEEGPRGRFGVGQHVTGRAMTSGNLVMPLYNGDIAYPDMLRAIEEAQHYVVLASYILQRDKSGIEFANALGRAVDRGVVVKVLVDGVGEWYSRPRISSLLRGLGITTGRFLPPTLLPPSLYINLRNHRKILVVDGRVAFAGGMNIADGNRHSFSEEGTSGSARISDVHFRLEGPIAQELALLFMDDWRFTTDNTEQLPKVAPAKSTGDCHCRMIPDGPDTSLDALALTIHAAISSAELSVDIMTPYFLPTRELQSCLVSALLRGVRVRIVLPAKNNLPFVHWANRNTLYVLLQWGAQVYYQPEPFSHSKLLCVDENYSLIGSANIDERSLRLNFELGIEVLSNVFTASLVTHVDAVVANSEPLAIEVLTGRSIAARLRDSTAALFAPYL